MPLSPVQGIHLLVINPNTSESVSTLLKNKVQAVVPEGSVVATMTARLGAPYIACEASYAVAGHAVLDAWAQSQQMGQRNDCVLIGCFGDPGLFALRQVCPVPVMGLAEAAFIEAGHEIKNGVKGKARRFAIVTGGVRWVPMLERLAGALGYTSQLAGIETVAPSGAELAANKEMALRVLTEACRHAVERWSVDAVILGGAGLAGLAAEIQPNLNVHLIDSVVAGARQVILAPRGEGALCNFVWKGVAQEMNHLSI